MGQRFIGFEVDPFARIGLTFGFFLLLFIFVRLI
jgi:hypothetical protein